MKRYDKKTEKAVIDRVKELKLSGFTHAEVVETLNKEGFKTSLGLAFNKGSLTNLISRKRRVFACIRRKSSKRVQTPGSVPKPCRNPAASVSRLTVEGIITDPSLTDRQRVGMLSAYLSLN